MLPSPITILSSTFFCSDDGLLCFVDFVFVETQNSGTFEYIKMVIRKTLQYTPFTLPSLRERQSPIIQTIIRQRSNNDVEYRDLSYIEGGR